MTTKLTHSSRELLQFRQDKRNKMPQGLPEIDILKIIGECSPTNPVAKAAFDIIEKASENYVSSVKFE